MWAWAQAGVGLPHQSRQQFASLPHVPIDQLQPGDLVFMGSPIHHVGIYVGGGMMVHASSPRVGVVRRRRSTTWSAPLAPERRSAGAARRQNRSAARSRWPAAASFVADTAARREPAELAAGRQHAVAGHHDRARVATERLADRLGRARLADAGGDLAVGQRLAGRDRAGDGVHRLVEARARRPGRARRLTGRRGRPRAGPRCRRSWLATARRRVALDRTRAAPPQPRPGGPPGWPRGAARA